MAKILIVEDKYDDMITVKTILEANHHNVYSASNAKEAIRILNKKINFNLILIDVILPDISGIKLLESIRDKFDKKLKCIYVTIVPRSEIGKSSIDGFVQKPFMPKVLENEVSKCLK